MAIHGKWYSGTGAQPVAATVQVTDDGTLLIRAQADDAVLIEELAATVAISSRLGNTARFLRFDSGASFETRDNDAVDNLQRQWQGGSKGLLHKLESHLGLVLVSAIVVAVLVWGGTVYGIPATSNIIAHQLPQDTLDTVADETLTILDKTHFSPSELSEERQAQLQQHFAPVLADFSGLPLKVLFRKGGDNIGANAFALPDGTMIFTDEIVALAKSDDELVAVLAHEVGHVALRHSLRATIQNAVLGFLYVTLVGDGSAVSDLLVGLPVLVTTLSYSRDHETEADKFSAQYLDQAGIERKHFVTLMRRLGESAACLRLIEDSDEYSEQELNPEERLAVCEKLAAEQPDNEWGDWLGYLSTHPNLEERLEGFLQHQH